MIAIAEVFNFAASIAGLYGVLPFRFPLLRGALYPAAAVLLSVTLARRIIPTSGVFSLILAILLSSLLYLALLLAFLALDKRCRTPRPPLDNRGDLGYNRCSIGR